VQTFGDGVYVRPHLSLTSGGKARGGKAKVKTGLGKSDRPGLQGGLRKRDLLVCAREVSQGTYREALPARQRRPVGARAVDLSRLGIYDELSRHDALVRVGGAEFITKILEAVPHAENAVYYAKIVHEKAMERAALTIFEQGINRLRHPGGGEPRIAIAEAIDKLSALTTAPDTAGSVEMRTRDWPDPPPMETYYGLAGDIVRAIQPHSEGDPVALLVQLLVGFGSLIGRTAHFTVEARHHYLNLFAVLVGGTSKGRKGTSWGRIRSVLERVEPTWADRIASGLSSGEGLIFHVRDGDEKDNGDSGVVDKRLLVVEVEFAGVLRQGQRDGNTLSPVLRAAWDDGTLRTLTRNNPLRATGAHVSIISHITRDELLRHLSSTETANGFANRFLWVCARRSKVLPEGGQAWPEDLNRCLPLLEQAVKFARTVGELRRSDGARSRWAQVYPNLSEGCPGLLGAVLARAEAQAMRLACLYAVLDLSPEVQVKHLEAALALWDYCARSARYIFGAALGDPTADRILVALREAGASGLSRTQIRDLFARHEREVRIEQA